MKPNPLTPRAHKRAPPAPKQKYAAAMPEEPAMVDGPASVDRWFSDQVAWLLSTIVHTALILVLALIVIPTPLIKQVAFDIVPPPEPADIPDPAEPKFEPPEMKEIVSEAASATVAASASVAALPTRPLDVPGEVEDHNPPIDDGIGELPKNGETGGDRGDGWVNCERGPGAFGSRSRRPQWPRGHGPTRESELAVEAALRWLAEHQAADGSWSFDHRDGLCQGRCRDPGSMKAAKNAATAMALMTFLGAGHSHVEGRYKENVARGLKLLLATLKKNDRVGSWHEAVGNATNYSHGMATLAVCEAYGMARDFKPKRPKSPTEMTEEERRVWKEKQKRPKPPETPVALPELRAAAQASLNYIMENQHSAGGWRYNTGQPGDTSVVGWMLMALKSGYMAALPVRPQTVVATSRFLDSVKHDDYGSIYHYLPDKSRAIESCKATTAIGLLCRMYMGWDRNHPGIAQGVTQLGAWGPELSATGRAANMYYNYYATQVMFHHGGEPWKKWNNTLRDGLVAAQSKEGHAHGSWHFTGDYGAASGGRLYSTTLAAMTLEVYYRYMPIYKSKSVEDRID